MSNLMSYPLGDGFETTLAQAWNGGTGTVYLNDTPSFTFPSGVTTYICVDPGKSTMQVAKIDSKGTGTVNVSSVTVEKGNGVNYSAVSHAVGATVIISDNYQFWKDIKTAVDSKVNTDATSTIADNIKLQFGDADAYIYTTNGGTDLKFKDGSNVELSLSTLASGGGADQKVAVTVSDTTTSVLNDKVAVGSGLTKTTLNPGGNEQLQLGIDSSIVRLTSADISSLQNSDYLAGEAITQGDSLFVETGTTFALATNKQNIGDVAGNTRVSFPFIGTGVAGTTLKLALCKTASPSTDLIVRLETDNAGSPSGTLLNANATATITAASLTTSLADTTVTLTGSITPTLGTKYHIVLAQTSDTVNGTNYFNVGYYTNDTTTRGLKLWNSSWGSVVTNKRCYLSSTLATDILLSKTDADFTYKLPDIPRLSTAAYTAGQTVKYDFAGISKTLSGLTKDTVYYIGNTPGALSTSNGTYTYALGYALSSGELKIQSMRGVNTSTFFNQTRGSTTGNTDGTVYLADNNYTFEILVSLSYTGTGGGCAYTIYFSKDNSTWYPIYANGISGNGGSATYGHILEVIKGCYYKTNIAGSVNSTGGTNTITLDKLRVDSI